jgi:hypothetical protein
MTATSRPLSLPETVRVSRWGIAVYREHEAEHIASDFAALRPVRARPVRTAR